MTNTITNLTILVYVMASDYKPWASTTASVRKRIFVHTPTSAMRNKAFGQCRGSYQENLISGVENWSGSSLAGRARKYSAHYAKSRENLRLRLSKTLGGSFYTQQYFDGERWPLGLFQDLDGKTYLW